MSRIIVVGGGLAALRTTENLRNHGFTGTITIVGEEELPAYNRPPLSKSFLTDGDRSVLELPQTHADTAEWHLGRRVSKLLPNLDGVVLDDGTQLIGDGLVLATGVRARRVLPEAIGSHVIRTADDAHHLRATVTPTSRVLVLGAGFLGCEVAASLAKLGAQVDLVEPGNLPLGPLGALVGTRSLSRLRELGIAVHLDQGVSAIERRGTACHVQLDRGTELSVDVVIEAVGSVPNTEAFFDSGLDVSAGVLATPDLKVLANGSAVDTVVVAGDVARFALPGVDQVPRRIEHWNLAFDTAKTAAHTLLTSLGHPTIGSVPAQPLPTFWCEFGSTRFDALGIPALGTDDVRVLSGDPQDHAAPLVLGYHDPSGRQVGAVLCDTRAGLPMLRRELTKELCSLRLG